MRKFLIVEQPMKPKNFIEHCLQSHELQFEATVEDLKQLVKDGSAIHSPLALVFIRRLEDLYMLHAAFSLAKEEVDVALKNIVVDTKH